MAAIVLNGSLASGLGRSGIQARALNVESQATTSAPFISPAFSGAGNKALGAVGASPTIALMVLIVGLGAFAYWVRPHLA